MPSAKILQFPQSKAPAPYPTSHLAEHLGRDPNAYSCSRCGAQEFRLFSSGAVYCADCEVRISLEVVLASSHPVGGGDGEVGAA